MQWSPRALLIAAGVAACILVAAIVGLIVDGGSEETLSAALAAHAQGRTDEASVLYREVLEDDPSNKFAHYNLGLIDQNAGRTEPAADSYRRALETDPRFVPALFNLAVLLTRREPSKAIAVYRKVIKIEPRRASAHLNLGFLLKETGKEAEGNAALRRAIRLDPRLEARLRPRQAGPATPAP